MLKTKGYLVKTVQLFYALMIGLMLSVFPLGAVSVHAAEPQANEVVVSEDMQTADDESSMMLIVLGGMLIVIISVVVVVAAVSALMGPIAEES